MYEGLFFAAVRRTTNIKSMGAAGSASHREGSRREYVSKGILFFFIGNVSTMYGYKEPRSSKVEGTGVVLQCLMYKSQNEIRRLGTELNQLKKRRG